MILRCPARLLKLLGVRAVLLEDVKPAETDWYANLFRLDRRTCLLLTQADTLFTVLEANVKRADLMPVGSAVVTLIERELRAEGLPTDTFGRLDPSAVQVAKTADRSVLGCMTDNTFLCRYEVAAKRGLAHTDLAALNRALRRNIHAPRCYALPLDPAAQLIGRV